MSFLGIICGLKLEADCLKGYRFADTARIAISGARPDQAESEARRLCDEGAKGLLSFGLCGGLDPDLRPGNLVVPSELEHDTQIWGISPFIVSRKVIRTPLGLGRDTVVADPEEKARLYQETGATIVDMESHRIAKVCQERTIPFYVLRAVCDPARQALPESAADAVDASGRARPLRVLRGLINNPGEIFDLVRLMRQTDAAKAALKRAAHTEVPNILRSVQLV